MGAPEEIILGIDVGSVSANIVSVGAHLKIFEEYYIRTHGNPSRIVRDFLHEYTTRVPRSSIRGISFTGTAGKVIAQLSGCRFENEIIAQTRAIEHLLPQVKTVIEIGGQDSKLIYLEANSSTGQLKIKDFSMNGVCAAGTGSFLDQQAYRLGLSIEEFSQLALRSDTPSRIAGRCSVFAKSDMIHLQQTATPEYDIVAGLCFAVARNFKSTIGKGFQFERPMCFQGGVAANAGMRRAFSAVLELAPDELIIPRYFASMGAIGAALLAWEQPEDTYRLPSLEYFEQKPARTLKPAGETR